MQTEEVRAASSAARTRYAFVTCLATGATWSEQPSGTTFAYNQHPGPLTAFRMEMGSNFPQRAGPGRYTDLPSSAESPIFAPPSVIFIAGNAPLQVNRVAIGRPLCNSTLPPKLGDGVAIVSCLWAAEIDDVPDQIDEDAANKHYQRIRGHIADALTLGVSLQSCKAKASS